MEIFLGNDRFMILLHWIYCLVNSVPWTRKQKPQFCSTDHVSECRIRRGSRGAESCPSPPWTHVQTSPGKYNRLKGPLNFMFLASRPPWICGWIQLIRLFIDFDINILSFCNPLWKLNVTIHLDLFISVKYEHSMSSTIALVEFCSLWAKM